MVLLALDVLVLGFLRPRKITIKITTPRMTATTPTTATIITRLELLPSASVCPLDSLVCGVDVDSIDCSVVVVVVVVVDDVIVVVVDPIVCLVVDVDVGSTIVVCPIGSVTGLANSVIVLLVVRLELAFLKTQIANETLIAASARPGVRSITISLVLVG